MFIVTAPLFGLTLGFLTLNLGKTNAILLVLTSLAVAWSAAILMFIDVCLNKIAHVYEISWSSINDYDLTFSFHYDTLTCLMAVLITTITFLVMIYSYEYLKTEPSLIQFYAYLTLFGVSMLVLVSSGNYLQLFIGWEGVGMASYLLVSFWDTRNDATQGGLKAIVVNRFGDVFFILALGIMWTTFKSFEIVTVSASFGHMVADIDKNNSFFELNHLIVTFLPTCLLLAACAKSAQIFFHIWLADAMEGPTPVSSLLHSATMVTAGIFLIIRSSHLFIMTPYIDSLMVLIGLLTALLPGLLGIIQSDIKKVIAYSTCSQ